MYINLLFIFEICLDKMTHWGFLTVSVTSRVLYDYNAQKVENVDNIFDCHKEKDVFKTFKDFIPSVYTSMCNDMEEMRYISEDKFERSLRCVVANVLDSGLEVSEFKL